MESKSSTLIIENPTGDSISKVIEKLGRMDLGAPTVVHSCADGIHAIRKNKPKLVILETELPDGSGFSILDGMKGRGFQLIVCSGNSNHRLKATYYDADAFLLSPYHPLQTETALSKVDRRKNPDGLEAIYRNTFSRSKAIQLDSVGVWSAEGFFFLPLKKIIRYQRNPGGGVFHLDSGNRLTSRDSFERMEKTLLESGFFRASSGLILNTAHINCILPGSPLKMLLSDGMEIPCNSKRFNKKFRK